MRPRRACPDREQLEARPGRPRKYPHPASNGVGFDSILDAVRSTQADLGRYRAALERIGSMVSEVLS
jgi:hypothetical protein